MLKDGSWLISLFLIITVALAGMCVRHVDKRNAKLPSHKTEKDYSVPADNEKPVKTKEYKHPGEYITD